MPATQFSLHSVPNNKSSHPLMEATSLTWVLPFFHLWQTVLITFDPADIVSPTCEAKTSSTGEAQGSLHCSLWPDFNTSKQSVRKKKKDRNIFSNSHINSSRCSHHAAMRAKTKRDSSPRDRGWGSFFCSNFFSFCCPALAQAPEPSSRANKTQWSIIVTLWKDFLWCSRRSVTDSETQERHIADMFQHFLSFSSRSSLARL